MDELYTLIELIKQVNEQIKFTLYTCTTVMYSSRNRLKYNKLNMPCTMTVSFMFRYMHAQRPKVHHFMTWFESVHINA